MLHLARALCYRGPSLPLQAITGRCISSSGGPTPVGPSGPGRRWRLPDYGSEEEDNTSLTSAKEWPGKV